MDHGAREPLPELAIANGAPAVLVGVLAQDGVQIDRWIGVVREELEAGADNIPLGMLELLLFDQSGYATDLLAEVGQNMTIGVALVVLVLFVTRGVRAAVVVALVLSVVTLATLATMNAIGLPIHQMSVTGLIVALACWSMQRLSCRMRCAVGCRRAWREAMLLTMRSGVCPRRFWRPPSQRRWPLRR